MIFESKKLTCVYTQLNSNSLCLSLKKNPTVPARRFALIPIVGNNKNNGMNLTHFIQMKLAYL